MPNRGARTNNGTKADTGGVVAFMQVECVGHGEAEVLEYVVKKVLRRYEKLGVVGRPLDENRPLICKTSRLPRLSQGDMSFPHDIAHSWTIGSLPFLTTCFRSSYLIYWATLDPNLSLKRPCRVCTTS